MIEYALSFVSVVKAGGFSPAAKNTSISKACLSRHVSQLETLLGVQLLHRTTRSLILTDAGRKFYNACEGIEQHYNDAVNSLMYDFKGMEGTLRLTAPNDFGIQFLPSVIESFSKAYPNMNIVLSLTNVNEQLVENNYDLAIRIANQLPDSSLRMSVLFSFKRIICASPTYLSLNSAPTTLEALKVHRCITSLNRHKHIVKPQWQFQANGKILNFTLDKYIEADSLFAQKELILRSTGIGRLPDYFARDAIQKGELIEVLPHIEKPDSYVHLLYPDTIGLPQRTKVFIEFLRNDINEKGAWVSAPRDMLPSSEP